MHSFRKRALPVHGIITAILFLCPLFTKEAWGRSHPINGCTFNLRQMEGAAQQWALEHRVPETNSYSLDALRPYLKGRELPHCPSGGFYLPGRTLQDPPRCTLHGTVNNLRMDHQPLSDQLKVEDWMWLTALLCCVLCWMCVGHRVTQAERDLASVALALMVAAFIGRLLFLRPRYLSEGDPFLDPGSLLLFIGIANAIRLVRSQLSAARMLGLTFVVFHSLFVIVAFFGLLARLLNQSSI
jgi:hypothetical protein